MIIITLTWILIILKGFSFSLFWGLRLMVVKYVFERCALGPKENEWTASATDVPIPLLYDNINLFSRRHANDNHPLIMVFILLYTVGALKSFEPIIKTNTFSGNFNFQFCILLRWHTFPSNDLIITFTNNSLVSVLLHKLYSSQCTGVL